MELVNAEKIYIDAFVITCRRHSWQMILRKSQLYSALADLFIFLHVYLHFFCFYIFQRKLWQIKFIYLNTTPNHGYIYCVCIYVYILLMHVHNYELETCLDFLSHEQILSTIWFLPFSSPNIYMHCLLLYLYTSNMHEREREM